MIGLIAAMLIPATVGAAVYGIDRCVIVASVYGVGADISYLILVYGGVI